MRLLVLGVLFSIIIGSACTDKTILQSQNDIARFVVGNVEIIFDFGTITGRSITVRNGNDRAVGVYIVDNRDQSKIVFSDSWIGKHKVVTENAVFDYGQELKVTVVVYKSLGAIIESFIQALGDDFLEDIESIWIEKRYESVIVIKK